MPTSTSYDVRCTLQFHLVWWFDEAFWPSHSCIYEPRWCRRLSRSLDRLIRDDWWCSHVNICGYITLSLSLFVHHLLRRNHVRSRGHIRSSDLVTVSFPYRVSNLHSICPRPLLLYEDDASYPPLVIAIVSYIYLLSKWKRSVYAYFLFNWDCVMSFNCFPGFWLDCVDMGPQSSA